MNFKIFVQVITSEENDEEIQNEQVVIKSENINTLPWSYMFNWISAHPTNNSIEYTLRKGQYPPPTAILPNVPKWRL